MDSLGHALSAALKQLEGNTGVEARAVMLWPELVGPELADRTEVREFRGGVLLIAVGSSVWSQELGYQKRELLRRYKQRLGPDVVKDIRTMVATLHRPTAEAAVRRVYRDEVRKTELTPRDEADIDHAAQGTVAETGQALRRALTIEAKRRRWNLEHGARACPRCGAVHRTSRNLCPACRIDASPPERGA